MEGSSNSPKLRRNASTASDMSSITSHSASITPGYTPEFDNFCCVLNTINFLIHMLKVVDFSEDCVVKIHYNLLVEVNHAL